MPIAPAKAEAIGYLTLHPQHVKDQLEIALYYHYVLSPEVCLHGEEPVIPSYEQISIL